MTECPRADDHVGLTSHNPAPRLKLPNSTLLDGDVPAAVAELRQASSGNLVIMGGF